MVYKLDKSPQISGFVIPAMALYVLLLKHVGSWLMALSDNKNFE